MPPNATLEQAAALTLARFDAVLCSAQQVAAADVT